MPITLIVSHEVADFNTWKAAFDSHAEARSSAGFSQVNVFQDEDNDKRVTIIGQVPSREDVLAFFGKEENKAVMQNAGVTTPPQLQFLKNSN